MVKFATVRLRIAHRKDGHIIVLIDISTAFLQSHSYENGRVKYIAFKNPFTYKWEYYRQTGPIYGEASAPIRWESTIAPWLIEQGFERGCNEVCVFYHTERDLTLLLYVDDILADGEPADVDWIMTLLEERFNCKDREYLTVNEALDYLGMLISMDSENIYLSMEKYIDNVCQILGIDGGRTPDTPMVKAIIAEGSPPLVPEEFKIFLTGNGMLGWLAQTVRLDVAQPYSRIAQHSAKPTKAALEALMHVFRYLSGTRDLALVAPLHQQSKDVFDFAQPPPDSDTLWRFFTDADHAGNAETQNARRSQNGYVCTLNGFATSWHSKASSVCTM